MDSFYRDYAPFGDLRSGTFDPGGVITGFTGHDHDAELGLIDMKGRVYDPSAGRFLSADPITDPTQTQRINPYAYVGNNPLNLTDPSGFSWWSDWGKDLAIDLGVALATTVVLQASIGTWDGSSVGKAFAAVGSTAGGAAASAVATATVATAVNAAQTGYWSWDTFERVGRSTFHTDFMVGAAYLAGGALASDIFAGGLADAGGNGLFGYVVPNEPLFSGPSMTLGSAAVFGSREGFSLLKSHEFGHTLQFIGLSALSGGASQLPGISALGWAGQFWSGHEQRLAWGSYLGLAVPGAANSRFGGDANTDSGWLFWEDFAGGLKPGPREVTP